MPVKYRNLPVSVCWLLILAAVALSACVMEKPELANLTADSIFGIWDDVIIDLGRNVAEGHRHVSLTPETGFRQIWSADGRRVMLSPVGCWAARTVYTANLPGRRQITFETGAQPRISVFAGGDVMLDMLPGENILQHGPGSVFAGMGDLISSADVAFVNLEGPVSNRGAPVAKRYTFCGRPDALAALSIAGVDVVSFANNHAMDYGQDAFLDTLTHLRSQGIGYVGAGRDREEALAPWIAEVEGLRVAFLAFAQRDVLPAWSYSLFSAAEESPGIVFHDGPRGREQVLASVRQAKAEADLVIVSLHWGYERETQPRAGLRDLGHDIIDAGATAIIGHHPHLPYGVEVYQGKPIIYSLGNFLFHPYNPIQRESYVAMLELTADGVTGLNMYPILMHDGVVDLLRGDAANNLVDTVISRSDALETHVTRQGDVLVVAMR